MPKIVDCFCFYNEFGMLDFRLKYLNDYVDYFVLIESDLTFSGNPKELLFEKNKHLYEKYKDKLIHSVVKIPTIEENPCPWSRDHAQKNLIDVGISKIDLNDDDIIIISDLDEIPDRNMIVEMKNNIKNDYCYKLYQDYYFYNLTCRNRAKWYFSKIVNYYTYKNKFNRRPDDIRYFDEKEAIIDIKNGGWHFAYFGDLDFIKNKIRNFTHQEYNKEEYLNDNMMIHQIVNKGDLFFRSGEDCYRYDNCPIETNNYLPDNYEELMKFQNNL